MNTTDLVLLHNGLPLDVIRDCIQPFLMIREEDVKASHDKCMGEIRNYFAHTEIMVLYNCFMRPSRERIYRMHSLALRTFKCKKFCQALSLQTYMTRVLALAFYEIRNNAMKSWSEERRVKNSRWNLRNDVEL